MWTSVLQGDPEMGGRIVAHNRRQKAGEYISTLSFRNTWSWGDAIAKPMLRSENHPAGCGPGLVQVDHPQLGAYHLYGRQRAQIAVHRKRKRRFAAVGSAQCDPACQNSFHRVVVDGANDAVNPERQGTQFATWHESSPGWSARSHRPRVVRAAARDTVRAQ